MLPNRPQKSRKQQLDRKPVISISQAIESHQQIQDEKYCAHSDWRRMGLYEKSKRKILLYYVS